MQCDDYHDDDDDYNDKIISYINRSYVQFESGCMLVVEL